MTTMTNANVPEFWYIGYPVTGAPGPTYYETEAGTSLQDAQMRAAAASQKYGHATITSHEGVAIYVNGRAVGQPSRPRGCGWAGRRPDSLMSCTTPPGGPMAVDRIRTERYLHAMVALDTGGLLAERVINLLGHGRRIAIARRYTNLDEPPRVTAGLTVVGEPNLWRTADAVGFGVALKPGMTGFSFSCRGSAGNRTEEEAWARFHAHESLSDSWAQRRQNMTEVSITGGLPGREPDPDDQVVIRAWNSEGVCDETVVVFDYDTRTKTIGNDA